MTEIRHRAPLIELEWLTLTTLNADADDQRHHLPLFLLNQNEKSPRDCEIVYSLSRCYSKLSQTSPLFHHHSCHLGHRYSRTAALKVKSENKDGVEAGLHDERHPLLVRV